MFFTILFAVIFILLLLILSFDYYPEAKRFFLRIGIGSLSDTQWEEKVVHKACNWLTKTPAIPLNDNEKNRFFKIITGKNKKENLQSWNQAALIYGLSQCTDENSRSCLTEFVQSLLDPETGEWLDEIYTIDQVMLVHAVAKSGCCDANNLDNIMQNTYKFLDGLASRYGTIPYNEGVPDYRFVDTIGMVCPFLAQFALRYDYEEAIDLAMEQIEEYIEKGLHKKTLLPVHCVRLNDGAPLGIYGWGRGCGWFAVGLAETYIAIESSGKFLSQQEQLRKIMELFSKTLCSFQNPDGSFSASILSEDYAESSATAMLGWFLAVNANYFGDEDALDSAYKALEYLKLCTRKNGEVDFAQGDTMGIGYYSTMRDTLPAAQGYAVYLDKMLGKRGYAD